MKKVTFYGYPKCGTCRKAKSALTQMGYGLEEINLVESPPSADVIRSWLEHSGLEVRKFLNTSGQQYRNLKLKERLPQMTEEEIIDLLAEDGRLIKRPVIVDGEKVTVGFREEQEQFWRNQVGK